jgi:hypothetical protein
MSLEFGNVRVLRHGGKRGEALDRYRAEAFRVAQESRKQRQQVVDGSMAFVSDERFLYEAACYISRQGGDAAGPDRIRPSSVSTQERWRICRSLKHQLQTRTYRPAAPKRAQVSKRPGSRAKRTIWVSCYSDRVVARCTASVVAPLLWVDADPMSFCRHARGPQLAVKVVKRLVEHDSRRVLISEDLRDAFDNVPWPRLRQILQSALPNAPLVALMEDLTVRPHNHDRGILQGSALSPLLLSLYLDSTVHRPWRRRHPDIPLIRYMDDCLLLCREADDPSALYNEFKKLVTAAGFQPKYGPDCAIHQLDKGPLRWLGYRLTLRQDELHIAPLGLGEPDSDESDHRLRKLHDDLVRLHERPNAWEDAPLVALGLLAHAAPTFAAVRAEAICGRLVRTAAQAGFDISREALLQHWRRRYEAWQAQDLPDDVLADLGLVSEVPSSERITVGPMDPPF